jgi:bacterioferritin
MPSIEKQQPAPTIATRSRRKPRRSEPLESVKRNPRPATLGSAVQTPRTTVDFLQEIVELLRVRTAVFDRHQLTAGDSTEPLGADKLRDLARENLTHSRWLAERIGELGGKTSGEVWDKHPITEDSLCPDNQSQLKADTTLEDGVAERCGSLLTFVGESDLTTKFLIEDILFDELENSKERHTWLAQSLASPCIPGHLALRDAAQGT